ncbi:MAG: hypothetical protein PHO37_04425 [Kiritimatiellae bacterium]|nr:hypothetical protein [Kiritimatiellia bacterium]
MPIRSGKLKKKPAALKSAAAGKLEDFRDQLKSNLEKNLPPLLNQKSNEDLRELSDYYQDQILTFRQGHPMLDAGKTHLELPELGLTTRWKP